MFGSGVDRAFARFRECGDPAALARVFDATAPRLLSLARHLASSEAAAEDLVQATFVTAIEARAEHDGRREVLPWLIGILANHARAARRKSKRAPDPVRLSRVDAVGALDAAAGAELSAAVKRAIEALPELYRSVVRMHLEHGLTPQEIHEVLERPAATVRSQLARGLEQVRRSLPIGVGATVTLSLTGARGLAQVRLSILSKVGGLPSSAAAVSLVSVVTIMTGKVAWVAVAAIAIASWFFFGNQAPAAPTFAETATVELDSAAAKSEPTPPAGASASLVDRVAVTDTGGARESDVDRSGEASPALRIRVRRARDGSLVTGARVRLRALDALTDLAAAGLVETTDSMGIASFANPPNEAVVVGLPMAERIRVIHAPRQEMATVDVLLPVGCTVVGQVVDAGGNPIAGAAVFGYGNPFEGSRLAESDAKGQFTIEDLEPMTALAARHPGHAPSLAQPIPDRRAETIELRLVLRGATRVLRGIVRDGDGRPSGGATVLAVRAGGATPDVYQPHDRAELVRCADDGSYVMEVDATARWWVVASPKSREHFTVTRVEVPPGDAEAVADVMLLRAASVEGRVSLAGSMPPGSNISAFLETPDQDIGYLGNGLGLCSAAIAADGTYRIVGLAPGTHRLSVTAGAHSLHESRLVHEGVREFWDVDLGGGSKLTVHVRGARPTGSGLLPMWSFRIYRLADGLGREFVGMARADAEGGAQFDSLAVGKYEVAVGVIGLGPLRDQVLELLPAEVPAVADVFCDADRLTMPSGSIRGRLIDADGAPVARRSLLAMRSDGLGTWGGTTADDGAFLFEPLMPGTWRIVAQGGQYQSIAECGELGAGESRDLGDLTMR